MEREVHRAVEQGLGRDVAIQVLHRVHPDDRQHAAPVVIGERQVAHQWIKSNIGYPYDPIPRFLGRRIAAGDAPASAKRFDAPRSRGMGPAGRLPELTGRVVRRL